ncbi:MAG: hypothetical protein P4L34_01035 [Paludibacter sp.]|nr:hypothetical protein [Paludibacter sp.]
MLKVFSIYINEVDSNKMKLKTLLLFGTLFLGIKQLLFVIDSNASATYIGAAASYSLMIIIFYILIKLETQITRLNLIIFIYLIWGCIAILRGFFEAENYWDWKSFLLYNILIMLLPLVSVLGSKNKITQEIFFNFIKYLLPLSIIVFFLSLKSINTDGFARFVSPIYYFIIFIPLLSQKWKVRIILIAVLSFLSCIDSRSNLIRIIVSFGLMSVYYLRHVISKKILELIRILIFVIPVLLFILAVTGIFDVFDMDSYIKGDYSYTEKTKTGENEDQSLTADTRTFIYEEVIQSGIIRNTWLFGESAVSGYISETFFDSIYNEGSKGREGSEVGILNIFNALGLIGVVLYTFVFFYASFLCVNRSRNYICKLLGIFIAFRWFYSWVEEFTDFDMNYFFLWLIIGLCFSESFRTMTNRELTIWVRGIFDKRYRKLEVTPKLKT